VAAPAGERVVAWERRHWISLVHPLFLASLPTLIVALALTLLRPALEVAELSGIAGLLVTNGAAIAALAVWMSTDVVLTTERVILRRGVLARSSKVIALERVQDVSTASTPLGRLLSFGRLEIEAAGASSRQVIDAVRTPELMRDRVFQQSRALRRSEDAADDRRRTAPTVGAGGIHGRRQDIGRKAGGGPRRDAFRRP
jgi:uncharacterized membrane protein YdbT with pleckstrin-like domain